MNSERENRRGTIALIISGVLFLCAATAGITARQVVTAAPSTITGAASSNSEGTSQALARADHTHACIYTATGTGAASVPCSQKWGERISARVDFGALCNGSADDTTALINANAAAVAAGRSLLIDCKVRIASAAGTIAAPLNFEGNGALDLSPASGSVTITGALLAPAKQIFFTGSGTLTFSAKTAQVVPQWWGAVGDGVTDDTAAIQAGVNAVVTAKGELFFPCGTYAITSSISQTSSAFGTVMRGASQSCVSIKATGAIATSMFSFTDNTANGNFAFKELTLNGNHLAAKGIASTQIRYISINRVVIQGTTTAAVDIAEGWDQNITDSQFIQGDGDGLRLGTNANNVRVRGCVMATNAGWGIVINTGVGVSIQSNDIEANQLGGIYMSSGAGTAGAGTLNIKDNYFEGNASYYGTGTLTSGLATISTTAAAVAIANANIGHTIVGPGNTNIPAGTTILSASGTTITMSANATGTVTGTFYITVGTTLSAAVIKTDILLNGSPDPTVLSQSFPLSNANVEGNTSTSHGATQFVAYTNSTPVSLRIVGNTHTTAYSEVAQIPNASLLNSGGLTALLITSNVGFSGRNNNGQHFHDRAVFSSSPVTPDLSTAEEFVIVPATNGAFTINAPANLFWTTTRPLYQYIVVRVRNQLGGGGALGAFTWNAAFKMAAWTNPADGFSRSITFSWDLQSNAWVEVSRTPADVPN